MFSKRNRWAGAAVAFAGTTNAVPLAAAGAGMLGLGRRLPGDT